MTLGAGRLRAMTKADGILEEFLPAELTPDRRSCKPRFPDLQEMSNWWLRSEGLSGGFLRRHQLLLRDARELELTDNSVQLVLTSPPYWTLKEYRQTRLVRWGTFRSYDEFH